MDFNVKVKEFKTEDLLNFLEYHRIVGDLLTLTQILHIETELEKRQLPNNKWLENRN